MNAGDYVRNEHFGIGRINKDYYDNENKHWFNVKFSCYNDEDCHCGINENTIGFKSSPNIIDLIEVGDYVNGYMVENIDAGLNGDVIEIATGTNYFQSPSLYEEDIKSIVTHEQFERVKYKL